MSNKIKRMKTMCDMYTDLYIWHLFKIHKEYLQINKKKTIQFLKDTWGSMDMT